MRRATTPTHEFTLELDPTLISQIRITYAQSGEIIVTKNTEDITLDGNVAKVRLAQEETIKFDAGKTVEIQVRILTTGNDALASEVMKIPCLRILDDGVMI